MTAVMVRSSCVKCLRSTTRKYRRQAQQASTVYPQVAYAGDMLFSNPLYGSAPGPVPRHAVYSPESNGVEAQFGDDRQPQYGDDSGQLMLLPPPPSEQLPLPAPHMGEQPALLAADTGRHRWRAAGAPEALQAVRSGVLAERLVLFGCW